MLIASYLGIVGEHFLMLPLWNQPLSGSVVEFFFGSASLSFAGPRDFFHYVLSIVWGQGLIDPTEVFIDGTHIKAAANNHKYTHQVLDKQAKFMSKQLEVEIDLDRKKHGKKSFEPAKES